MSNKPRRSESGHGYPSLLLCLALAAMIFGPPLFGLAVGIVAAVRQHPWWVCVLVGLGAAGYVAVLVADVVVRGPL